MKKLTFAMGVGFSFLATTGTSIADWQYTKWGMSPKQVITASQGAAKPLEFKVQYRKSLLELNRIAKLKAPYSSGQFRFEAFFLFDEQTNLLSTVRLELLNIESVDNLFLSLKAKYGPEYNLSTDGPSSYYTWYTKKDRIILIVIGTGGMATVVYEPRGTRDTDGL